MARPNFLNENSGRSFPFVQASLQQSILQSVIDWIPKSTIVDFGAVMGVNAGYDPAVHEIRLRRIALFDGRWYFYFVMEVADTDVLSLNHWLVFSRAVGETGYVTSYAEAIPTSQLYPQLPPEESAEVSVSVSVNPCPQTIPWEGYLTTGDLTEFEAWMGASTIKTSSYATIEPALIQNQNNSFVNTINVANADRTRPDPPEGCRDLVWVVQPEDVYIAATCVTGRLRFEEGYNVNIQQQNTENRIRIGAAVGEGAGEVCDPVPLFPGERPPLGGTNLDGALSCNDVIRSINGIGGRIVQMLSGPGVTISPDPGNNRIDVAVDLNSLKACIEFAAPVEESECSFASNDTESCGPV